MMGYSESWIDEEGLSESAFLFLRDLVVVYQTRSELLSFINMAPGFIDHSGLTELTKLEIKNWILKIAGIELSNENKKLKQQLWESQHRPVAPKVLKDDERFERFEQALFFLCKAHKVSIDADYDGRITIIHKDYKEDSEPDLYIENGLEITEEEKRAREHDSVFYNGSK
jgi:hypothetical protein